MPLEKHLDKLEAFVAIGDSKKLSDASRVIGLSQPSLSRLIDTLEDVTEVKLVERGRSGSQLTPAGEKLYAYAKRVLSPLKDLEAQLKTPGKEEAGLIRIGSYESLAEYLWPDFLKKIKKKHPDIYLSIKTSQQKNCEQALEHGDIDILVDAEPRVVGDIDSFPLYSDSFSFYTTKGSAPTDLQKTSLIFVPSAFDQNEKKLSDYIREAGLQSHNNIELDSFTSARSFCEQGLGLAILPNRLAASTRSRKTTLVKIRPTELPLNFGKHRIYATVLSRRVSDVNIKWAIKELKQWFK